MNSTEIERVIIRQADRTKSTIDREFAWLDIPPRRAQIVDWDALEQERVSYLPQHRNMGHAA